MSLKHTTNILLLAVVLSAGFVSAFNSDRLQDANSEIKNKAIERGTHRPALKSLTHQRQQNSNGNNKHVTTVHSAVPHVKGGKGLKRRHVRNRRDRLSGNPITYQNTPRSFANNFNYQQRQVFQNPTYPWTYPFVAPNEVHNTFVRNGPQVNNYNSPFPGIDQTNWQQASAFFSFLSTSVPIIVILPPPRTPQPIIPATNPTVNVTVDDRFLFNEDPPSIQDPSVVPQRRNTTTGISLDIAIPPHRPSRPLPPIQRPQSNLLATGESKMVAQESRPLVIQRPQALPQSVNFAPTITQDSYNIGQARPVNTNISPCVRAILSCCQSNGGNQQFQERCFEAVGCSGAFYDSNPCSRQMARAAEQAAGSQIRA